MVFMRAGLLALVFALSNAEAEVKPKTEVKSKTESKPKVADVRPLLTTEIFEDTYALLKDLYEVAGGEVGQRFHVQYKEWRNAKGMKGFGLSEVRLLQKLEEKTGVKEADVLKYIDLVQTKFFATWNLAVEQSAPVRHLVYQRATEKANEGIDTFEAFLPKYKGLIPRNAGDFFLFMTYMLFVVYLIVRVVRFAIRLFFGLVCCVLCCRCCRRKEKAVVKKGKNKGKEVEAKPVAAQPAAKKAAGSNQKKK